jgi:hypothetical protein
MLDFTHFYAKLCLHQMFVTPNILCLKINEHCPAQWLVTMNAFFARLVSGPEVFRRLSHGR